MPIPAIKGDPMQLSAPPQTLRPTSTTRQHIHLAARRMNWNFSDVPRCPVMDGDPNLAAFLLTLSYFVVAFEDYGIPVVRADLPRVKDHPVLAREAQAFISQEALHSQGHVLLNNHMNDQHGIDTKEINRVIADFKTALRRGNQQFQMASVAAFEHVIYSVADWYERATEVHQRVHPEVHRLVLWHAMEETEHTAVVYDMYSHIYGDRPDALRVRLKALAFVTPLTIRTVYKLWRALVPQMEVRSGQRGKKIEPWTATIKEASRYLGDLLSFLSPSFNPWDHPLDSRLLPALRTEMRASHGSDQDKWMTVLVASVREVGADVRMYEFSAVGGGDLPDWTAGSHIDVEIEPGIIRQYSLCGDPADCSRYVIAVKNELFGRGGSLRMHEEVQVGHRIRIGYPRNNFALTQAHQSADEVLLLAGGIGVTPLLSMARVMHAGNKRFKLHIWARDRQHLAFAEQMSSWPFANSVFVHLDAESPSPSGRVEVSSVLPAWDEHQPRAMYVCGPTPFMDAALSAAKQLSWPSDTVKTERFAHVNQSAQQDHAFIVHLKKSNQTIGVEADQTIVEAMESRGLFPTTSCREGICGACVSTVVNGAVDHRDVVLSETEHQEAKRIAICVSRAAQGHLTLDL